jgi:hypothetical protein
MSLESFAFENLKRRHPHIRKNGLRECLRQIDAREILGSKSLGFIPDATELIGDTLYIYEIEDTNRITSEKLAAIRTFGHDLYDTSIPECYTVLVVVDRYGINETIVWRVKDEIMWTYEPTGEWLSESEIERREAQSEKGT